MFRPAFDWFLASRYLLGRLEASRLVQLAGQALGRDLLTARPGSG